MSVTIVIVVVLLLGVIFVNGWTDAPNAIATVVSTRVLSPSAAVKLAIVFNFLGVLFMTLVNSKVAATLSNMIDFSGTSQTDALAVLAGSMFAIVVWAVAAWKFGIPTSESHALIAGITGGAVALGANAKTDISEWLSVVNGNEWIKVIIGLLISSIVGFGAGFIITKLIEFIFRRARRAAANKVFSWAQTVAAAAMAFLHGAQDGQKFIGIFLLAIYMYNPAWVGKAAGGAFVIPLWLIVLCSLTMGIGTSIGGYKIIKAVGMDMVKLEKYQGFAADLSASICILVSTLNGFPVSTTHTKTTAIMGVGASKRVSNVNWTIARDMVIAWVATFPGCGLIAFLMSLLFLQIF